MSVDQTIKKQKKGTVYFKCSCVADGGANRRSTDAPGPRLWGRGQLSSAMGQIQAAGRGEKKSQMESLQ